MTIIVEAVAIPALVKFYEARNEGASSREQCEAAIRAAVPVILHQVMGRIIEHREESVGERFNLDPEDYALLAAFDIVLDLIPRMDPNLVQPVPVKGVLK